MAIDFLIDNGDSLTINRDLKILMLAGNSYHDSEHLRKKKKRKKQPLEDKCFAIINGKRIIDYNLDSLTGDLGLSHIYVVASEKNLKKIEGYYDITGLTETPGNNIYDNIRLFLDNIEIQPGELVLLIYPDHLFQTPSAFRHFLYHAHITDDFDAAQAEGIYEYYRNFNVIIPRGPVHTRELRFNCSGMILVRAQELDLEIYQKGYDLRKQEELDVVVKGIIETLKLVFERGRGIWIRTIYNLFNMYVAHFTNKLYVNANSIVYRRAWKGIRDSARRRTPLSDIENFSSCMLRSKKGFKVVPNPYAHINLDIDYKSDLEQVQRNHAEIMRRISELEERIAEDAVNSRVPPGLESVSRYLTDPGYLNIR